MYEISCRGCQRLIGLTHSSEPLPGFFCGNCVEAETAESGTSLYEVRCSGCQDVIAHTHGTQPLPGLYCPGCAEAEQAQDAS